MTGSEAYEAARKTAAFAEISDHGWLRLTGRDRLDLLHRISTNHVKNLPAGAGAPTVLTNASARIIALLIVYAGQETVFVRTMPGQASTVQRYVQGLIFWQDEVTVADASAEVAQFSLYGPEASARIGELAGVDTGALAPAAWTTGKIGGAAATVHRDSVVEPYAFTIVVPAASAAHVRNTLAECCPALSPGDAELLRIEAGLPGWGRELSDQVTPLETGLLPAIHFNKGCYTGQEVIARQTNYDKVTRNLVGLVFGESVDLWGEGPSPLAEVKGPGRGGFVGSLAHSPRLGRTIGLAVIPRELAQPGTTITVVRGEVTCEATVAALPFAP